MLQAPAHRLGQLSTRPRLVLAGGFALGAGLVTALVRQDGPVGGEVTLTRWLHDHTPGAVSAIGAVLDPLITDLTAPVVFAVIALATWSRWGRQAATVVVLAGCLTALTRIGDVVQRPRPTSQIEWTTYSFGNGGYPSGHVVFTVLVLGGVVVAARRHASPNLARRLAILVVATVALTCWTRVSRLEHWPLDVVGGLLMGLAALQVVAWAADASDPLTAEHPRLRRLLGFPGT